MKARVGRGRGAAGLMRYLHDEGKKATGLKRPEIVGGSLTGTKAAELTRELTAIRAVRPDIKKHLWHCSLALPPGERLTAQQWDVVAADFMHEMGFTDQHARIVIRHNDTEHDHIHIVASRIGLDGSVWLGQWEVPKAIEATQALEKRHGLMITKGLYDDEHKRRPADRAQKSLTPAEINRAVRTGEEPPRQRLQRLVDAAAEGAPTVVEFAERLTLAGVSVRANVASTGRMNGFSFEVEGIPFKGSDLGKQYTWKGLQDRGITYEQARDRAGIDRFRAPVADRADDPAATAADRSDAAGTRQPAGSRGERDEPGALRAGDVEAGRETGADSVRQSDDAPASGAGLADRGDDDQGRCIVRVEDGSAGTEDSGSIDFDQTDGQHGAADRQPAGAAEHSNEQPRNCERELDQGGLQLAAATVEAPSDDDSSSNAGRRDRKPGSSDWSSRFRAASAAKRRAEGAGQLPGAVAQGHEGGARVDAADRQSARELDPSHYLESHGFEVVRDGTGGRHLSVRMGGDEMYRLTKKHDGHWLWCDLYGNSGGDNIDLVKEIEGVDGFSDAVYRLVSAPIQPVQVRPEKPRTPPTLPVAGYGSKAAGRQYLEGRGIAPEVIDAAEAVGMLRYAPGSLFFVGYDAQGTAQAATRRATDPTDDVQRRDLKGTDKRFPAILPGDPRSVWIVEGGIDSLALHTMSQRRGERMPTVIVSGGAGVRSFLERAEIQQMLRQAERVVVAYENEKDQETQERTDAQHDAQVEAVREVIGRMPETFRPRPEHGKDLADLNTYQLAVIERRRAEQERAEAEAQRVARPDRGLEM